MKLKYHFLRFLGYKTIDELFKELHDGKRKQISNSDVKKSTVLERSLYPIGIRYPKTGDIYVCINEAEITYLTYWVNPYTGGEKTFFPKGEKIRIAEVRHARPIGVYCNALNSDEIEKLLIPQADREQYDYNGYNLYVDTITLNKKFALINGA